MTRATLQARRRETGHPRRVRAQGDVPGILYGPGQEPTPVRVSRAELARLLAEGHAHGLVDLVLEGSRPVAVLLREVQREPVKGELLHVDFLRVPLDKPVEVTVPLRLVGVEEVERRGGVVQHQLHELEISCLPADVPEAIEVDVSRLEVGDALRAGEIAAPPGVTVTHDPEEVVLTILAPHRAEEEAEPAQAEAAEAEGGTEEGA